MKPKFDHRINRPGGIRYDMGAPTDLASKFAAIKKTRAKEAAATARIVTPIKKRVVK